MHNLIPPSDSRRKAPLILADWHYAHCMGIIHSHLRNQRVWLSRRRCLELLDLRCECGASHTPEFLDACIKHRHAEVHYLRALMLGHDELFHVATLEVDCGDNRQGKAEDATLLTDISTAIFETQRDLHLMMNEAAMPSRKNAHQVWLSDSSMLPCDDRLSKWYVTTQMLLFGSLSVEMLSKQRSDQAGPGVLSIRDWYRPDDGYQLSYDYFHENTRQHNIICALGDAIYDDIGRQVLIQIIRDFLFGMEDERRPVVNLYCPRKKLKFGSLWRAPTLYWTQEEIEEEIERKTRRMI